MTRIPHSTWAHVYDTAYKNSFGAFLDDLTCLTLRVVHDLIGPPARIVDFGAGTGRLAVPLANAGYRVTAVDACAEMLEQLRRKDLKGQIETFESSMQDFDTDRDFDQALCVFTVVLYLLDRERVLCRL